MHIKSGHLHTHAYLSWVCVCGGGGVVVFNAFIHMERLHPAWHLNRFVTKRIVDSLDYQREVSGWVQQAD